MSRVKKLLSSFPSYVQTLIRLMNRGSVAWSIILGLLVLEIIPVLLPGLSPIRISFFFGMNLITLIVAALLRARRGALLV